MSEALQHAATHFSTLQHTATHCNTLQHTATHCNTWYFSVHSCWRYCSFRIWGRHCNTLQHAATHCNTHCNTLQHAMFVGVFLLVVLLFSHTSEALQHTATHFKMNTAHCNTLQETATHCNTRCLHVSFSCQKFYLVRTKPQNRNHQPWSLDPKPSALKPKLWTPNRDASEFWWAFLYEWGTATT